MNSGASDFLNASRWVAAFFVSSNWALPELDTNCRSSMGRKIVFKSRGIWGMSVENYFARVEAAATALVARLLMPADAEAYVKAANECDRF